MIIGAIVSWQLHSARRRYFATHSNEMQLRARLQELAYRDELTGVLNRRSFLLEADALWRKFAHSKLPACLFMLDLDHFKQINALLGHEAGDRRTEEHTYELPSLLRITYAVFALHKKD